MLSIIIPLHNESQRLPGAMEQIKSFKFDRYPDLEVLLMDNGSTDGTHDLACWYADTLPWVRAWHSDQRGKGRAVAAGMLQARGTHLYMCDVDLSTPLDEVFRFIINLDRVDIVIGSRELDRGRVQTTMLRRVIGRVFHEIVSGLVPGIHDTQCGFKMFKRSVARDLFSRMKLGGLAFDVELLYLARQAGMVVTELPVQWRQNFDSRVRLGLDSLEMLRDVLSIPGLHADDAIVTV